MSLQKIFVLFFLSCFLMGCRGQGTSPLEDSTATPNPDSTVTPDVLIEEASDLVIEDMRVVVQGSNPAQVEVTVRGLLPDTCTSIERIKAEQYDDEFVVKILTRHEASQDCVPDAREFEDYLLLEAEGLSAGTYTVSLKNLSGSFTIEEVTETPDYECG